MKSLVFYLDFISPYAYLAFEKLPQALEGMSVGVEYRPVLFAGLLDANGQRGPAEIPGKREWTYRQVQWLAHSQGVALQLPAAHPFNPLALLRLALACSEDGKPNRYVCETLFRHVWTGGGDAADPARLDVLMQRLRPVRDINGADVKGQLRRNTDAAIAAGVFGVPTVMVEGEGGAPLRPFWGFDSLAMLRAALLGDPWFESPAWQAAASISPGDGVKRS